MFRALEPVGVVQEPHIVRERGVSVAPVLKIGHAASAVAQYGNGQVERPRSPASRVFEPRKYRQSVTRPTEAIALADEVAHRDSFNARSEVHGQAADPGKWVGHAGFRQVAVRDGHDRFQGKAPAGVYAVGLLRSDRVASIHEQHRFPDGLEGLRAGDDAPTALS